MEIYKNEDILVEYAATEEIKQQVFNAIIEYYKKVDIFSGEGLYQSDHAHIEAMATLSEIADNIIKFKYKIG